MPETAYERFVRADKILAFQTPEKDLVCDGERHFQGVQQEAEFIWTRINLLLKRTHERLRHDDLFGAAHLLEHAASLWGDLTKKTEELMSRLWPKDFFKVRVVVGGGSTGESPRYQESERLGRKLWDPYQKILKKNSLSLKKVLERDEDDALRVLTQAMMWYDYRVQDFNVSHLYLVWGQIGDRTLGLQGRTTEYLIQRFAHYLFPQLWEAVNDLYSNTAYATSKKSEQVRKAK